MANTHTTLASLFDDTADAIRETTGTTASIVADNFPNIIRANDTTEETNEYTALLTEALAEIEGKAALGGNATAEDIREGKTAYVNGQLIEGLMQEGTSGIEYGIITASGSETTLTINHTLGVRPCIVALVGMDVKNNLSGIPMNSILECDQPWHDAMFGGATLNGFFSYSSQSSLILIYGGDEATYSYAIRDESAITFKAYTNGSCTFSGTYMWIAKA